MILNNILKITLLALFTIGAATAADAAPSRTAAGKTKAGTTTSAPAIKKGETHTYGSDLTTQIFTYDKGNKNMVIEYPISGSPVLLDAIRAYIAESVCEGYNGPLDTPDGFMNKAAANLGRDGIELELKIEYGNDKLVTYNGGMSVYPAGADTGLPWVELIKTFLLSDGTLLTYDILPSISTLRPYIIAAVEEFSGEPASQWDIDISEIELPYNTNPYINADGLVLQYGPFDQYPLTRATVIIPAEEARKIVHGKAVEFF